MKIVLATKNKGKLVEMFEVLYVSGIEFVPASQFDIPEIEETESLFYRNALLKARIVNEITGMPTIADDSGLEIDCLARWPGVFSARCAGEHATDQEKVEFVLNKMKDITDRKARFTCSVALVNKPNIDVFFTGFCEGELLYSPRGIAKPGLQYDTIFHTPVFGKSLAELTDDEKNSISHRGKALKKMKYFLETDDFIEATLLE